ncbi:histidine phosphatase family protein [Kitasatospora sp. NBC_00315]|uniref:histidine phosphatase family protein n=1 Tax=Kitasatospora sp. NBC_00315 TaxID=2975963 RepID=UPI003245166B
MSTALREARFDADGPLDPVGLRQARDAAPAFPAGRHALSSPSARCAATAGALGLKADPVPGLAGCAMGRWTGRTLTEVAAVEPDALAGWLADPAVAPHGGESLLEFLARVGSWLDGLTSDRLASDRLATDRLATDRLTTDGTSTDGTRTDEAGSAVRGPLLAVVEPDVVRAAVLHALGVPGPAFWRLDVRPLSVTELSGRAGRWNVRCGGPADGAAG